MPYWIYPERQAPLVGHVLVFVKGCSVQVVCVDMFLAAWRKIPGNVKDVLIIRLRTPTNGSDLFGIFALSLLNVPENRSFSSIWCKPSVQIGLRADIPKVFILYAGTQEDFI